MVHRSSETSTNQSDLIIRSDDRFLNLVVDSDSICLTLFFGCFFLFFCLHTDKNIAVLSQLVFSICLTLFFGCFFLFFCLHTDKNIAVLSQLVFFFPHTDKHLAVLSERTFDTRSIHIFGLVYYLSTSRNSPFYIRCYTYGKRSFVLF